MLQLTPTLSRAASRTLLCLLTFAPGLAFADEIVVELPVGHLSADQAISADTLSATADGRPVDIVTAQRPTSVPRVVLFVDRVLAPPLSVHNALLALADQAPRLVELGAVEVISAGDQVVTSVPSTRSPESLTEALSWLRLRTTSDGGQLVVRKRFVDETHLAELADKEHLAISATAGQRLAEIGALVRESLAEEAELLSRFREQLLTWAVSNPSEGPKTLILVGGGFDTDTQRFYRDLLAPFDLASIVEDEPTPEISPTIAELGQTLSALGWTVWSVSPEGATDLLLEGGEEKERAEVVTVYEGGREVDKTVITPRFDVLKSLKGKLGGKGKAFPEAALLAPREGLDELARETGGGVVVDGAQLEKALSAMASRISVTVDLPPDLVDLAPVDVTVLGPRGARLETRRRWASRGTPPLVAIVRARQLLDADLAEGGLVVEAVSREPEEGGAPQLEILAARTIEDGEAASLGRLLVTTVAFENDGRTVSRREVVTGRPPGSAPITLGTDPAVSPDVPVVVIVEDLASGLWGGAYAAFVSADGFDALGTLGGLLPAPRAIHLLAPREPLAVGRTRIDTVLSERVDRVEFYLDGKLESTRKSPPFSVSVTLGKYPDRHAVEAVAFDSDGLEIGRDQLVLNAGTGTFRVRLVSPENPGDPNSPLAGAVTVRAAVEMPRGAELNRVQFFWNDELFATRFAPPFKQRFQIPDDAPAGFFRVEALLADGSQTEDVLFINSPGGTERVRVELVELFTVVTDREGHPVTRLPSGSFRVFEDGVEQEVTTFNEAGDLPLTVGLAIDSSASMFVKLPDVQAAAAEFVNALAVKKDRAFVVRFGGGPELVRDTTRDLDRVEQALYTLEPDGRTEIWKGIVYSLVQLQSVPGKKALIVFSDGADEDPDFSYRTCLRFARRVGVPVYVIVSNDEIYRTEGKGLTIRSFMNRLDGLVRSVGGRVFVTRVGGDLTAIYDQIDEELRSQYLLGYYVRDAGGERWREVQVEVDGRGLEARTISGYFR